MFKYNDFYRTVPELSSPPPFDNPFDGTVDPEEDDFEWIEEEEED